MDKKRLYWAGPAAAAVLGGAIYLLSKGGPPTDVPGGPDASAPILPAVSRKNVPVVGGKPAEVVYELVSTVDKNGKETVTKSGKITPKEWERAARPWTNFDGTKLYHDQFWSEDNADGSKQIGYRVLRTDDAPKPAPARAATGKPDVDEALLTKGKKESVNVNMTLRGFPEWNIPLKPPVGVFTDAERATVLAAREKAIAERKTLLETRAADLISFLNKNKAKVTSKNWSGGRISAQVKPEAFKALLERDDVSKIIENAGQAESGQSTWPIGETRFGSRMDLNAWATKYPGDFPNPSRHSYGRETIGIVERGPFKDEACYYGDTFGCGNSTRVIEKFQCDGPTPGDRCFPVTGYGGTDTPSSFVCCNVTGVDPICTAIDPNITCQFVGAVLGPQFGCGVTNRVCNCVDSPTNTFCTQHATTVANIAIGDYTDGQADNVNIGDDECGTSPCIHSPLFKDRGTGMAREAKAILFGEWVETTQAEALDSAFSGLLTAQMKDVDITNASWSFATGGGVTSCSIIPTADVEDEVENLFDDGVFPVQCTGNVAANVGCTIQSPSDIPKAFAVSGLQGTVAGCQANYNACQANGTAGARGGISVTTPDLVVHAGVASGVSMLAPTAQFFFLGTGGTYGTVQDNGTVPLFFGGCSGAVPEVSGAAAVVKNKYLTNAAGAPFINEPGRMTAVMLLNLDRYSDPDPPGPPFVQLATGYDLGRYGGGKLRVRPDASLSKTISFTATTTAPILWVPLTKPIKPTEAAIFKCILYQIEDMSTKAVVSDIDLKIDIQTPDGTGACTSSTTTNLFSRSDTSFDLKKQVAITSTDVALAGACPLVTAIPSQIAPPAATFIVACRNDPCNDDQNCDACTPGSTDSCGCCGTKTCDNGGDFGPCMNEGQCCPGDMQACGPCGTGQQVCGGSCTFGACVGDGGPCVP